MDIEIPIASAIASGTFGVIKYLQIRAKAGEQFNPHKLGTSVAFGFVIGLAYGLLNIPLTEDIILQLATFAGMNAAGQNIVDYIYTQLKNLLKNEKTVEVVAGKKVNKK
jgi:hypothetical protein